ncbi:hypothetical protein Tco_0089917 [Tanacetum coccineum]
MNEIENSSNDRNLMDWTPMNIPGSKILFLVPEGKVIHRKEAATDSLNIDCDQDKKQQMKKICVLLTLLLGSKYLFKYCCAGWIKISGEVRARTLFVLSSSNRGRLLGIIDLMRQKNKRMKQEGLNRQIGILQKMEFDYKLMIGKLQDNSFVTSYGLYYIKRHRLIGFISIETSTDESRIVKSLVALDLGFKVLWCEDNECYSRLYGDEAMILKESLMMLLVSNMMEFGVDVTDNNRICYTLKLYVIIQGEATYAKDINLRSTKATYAICTAAVYESTASEYLKVLLEGTVRRLYGDEAMILKESLMMLLVSNMREFGVDVTDNNRICYTFLEREEAYGLRGSFIHISTSGEVRARTLFVLSSSNRGRLLGIIDLMRQKNKRMKQEGLNRQIGILQKMEFDYKLMIGKLQDEVVLFYNGLDVPTRQILDSRGVIPSKTAADAKTAIQEMAEYS